MATRETCSETLGIEHKTLVPVKTLGFLKPVANPWPTRDLPVLTRDLNPGYGPQNHMMFLSVFQAFLGSKTQLYCAMVSP